MILNSFAGNFLEVGKCDRKIVRTQARERGLVAERHLEDPEIESRDNIPIFRAFDKKTQPPKSVEKKGENTEIEIESIYSGAWMFSFRECDSDSSHCRRKAKK